MGCGGSKTADDEMDAKINHVLKEDRKKLSKEVKLLLLGNT